jgi:hypothetical protein
LRSQNLHRLIIIARRENRAKWRDAACARSDKLANITRSLPHRFIKSSIILQRSDKGGEDQWLKFQLFTNQRREGDAYRGAIMWSRSLPLAVLIRIGAL